MTIHVHIAGQNLQRPWHALSKVCKESKLMQQHVPESCTSAGLFKAVRRLAQRARVSPSCNFIRATRCLRQLVLILLASDILPASSSPFLSAQQGAISDQITMPAAQKFTEGCTTFLFNGAGADRASCSICKPAEADPHAAATPSCMAVAGVELWLFVWRGVMMGLIAQAWAVEVVHCG